METKKLLVLCLAANLGFLFPQEKANPSKQGRTLAPEVLLVVYKSPTCGCCTKWEDHMRSNGFDVESHPTAEMTKIKSRYHVPPDADSCHTAIIGNYVIEGHVPAAFVKKLLKENPADLIGLAVPGMPTGSPGMEGPNPQHYDVLGFDSKGKTMVYARQ